MFKKAKWIWHSNTAGTDNYGEFKTEISCTKGDSVSVRISAASNYAIYINGVFADSGQYGDYPHYKVYDEIDVSRYIVDGVNHIAIIGWYCGVFSFVRPKELPGLVFEVLQNGEVTAFSSQNTLCRQSHRYINGKNELITMQVGLNFHLDMTDSNAWMTQIRPDGFGSCVETDGPDTLFERPVKKLTVEERIDPALVQCGGFNYNGDYKTIGEQMQYAALSFQYPYDLCKDEIYTLPEAISAQGIYLIFDLHRETAGYLDFDITVPGDCRMDIGWGEHLADGRCRTAIPVRDFFAGFVRNFSASVQLKKGRNAFMNPLKRLGGRYLQVFLHTKQAQVHYIGLRPTTYPVKVNPYKGNNLLRKKIYEVSINTLRQCMHEHYEDCPWREQAFYTLDSRNQMLCGYYGFSEKAFPKAGLTLISKSIREDGLLPICFPAEDTLTIPSFSLYYILMLSEYYQHTGDQQTIADCFACAEKIIHTFLSRVDETGLIPNFDEKQNYWNFYEWRPYLEGQTYSGFCHDMCLNAIFSMVLEAYMALCQVVGQNTETYQNAKNQINSSIYRTFYHKETGMFEICDRQDINQYSVLANALGYLCSAVPEGEETRLVQTILNNGNNGYIEIIPTTLSMHTFRYEALLRADKDRYKHCILEEIDEVYSKMLMKDATSFWETEDALAYEDAASLCHGWSAMPVYYYNTLEECGSRGLKQ